MCAWFIIEILLYKHFTLISEIDSDIHLQNHILGIVGTICSQLASIIRETEVCVEDVLTYRDTRQYNCLLLFCLFLFVLFFCNLIKYCSKYKTA